MTRKSDAYSPAKLAELAAREWTEELADCYSHLDPSYPSDYRALATLLASEWSSNVPTCVGLGGGQGAGKSTLSRLIEPACARVGIRACVLSLDDFYFPRVRRMGLAAEVHPLLETRGPPGTHDILQCREAMHLLRRPGEVELPVFDKGIDDQGGVRLVSGSFDLVLLEGWCVAALPVDEKSLETPINDLEKVRDPDATWRRYVNTQLAETYAATWDDFDYVVYLRVPDLGAVRRWRLQQETSRPESQRLDVKAVDEFVQHFERITYSMMELMPQRADLTVGLADDHSIASIALRSE